MKKVRSSIDSGTYFYLGDTVTDGPEDPHSTFLIDHENTQQSMISVDLKYNQCLDFNFLQNTKIKCFFILLNKK